DGVFGSDGVVGADAELEAPVDLGRLEVHPEGVLALLLLDGEGAPLGGEAFVEQVDVDLFGDDAPDHAAEAVLAVAPDALGDLIRLDAGLARPFDAGEGQGQAGDGGAGDGRGQQHQGGGGQQGGEGAEAGRPQAAGVDDALEVEAGGPPQGAADGLAAHAGGL